jgi:regulator of CtrA degradation
MRLTTRLMQLASWLLLHRAVNEGEMSLAQANKEKAKVKLATGDGGDAEMVQMLPDQLRDLIARSVRLQERVRRLDATIHSVSVDQAEINPVERQMSLLKAAFERDGV